MRYCTRFGVPDDLFTGDYSKAHIQEVTSYFVAFLRGAVDEGASASIEPPVTSLKADTIDQYISHVIKHVFEHDYVDDAGSYFRTKRTAQAISGFRNADHAAHPQRTRCKIPFSAALVVVSQSLSRSL
jgi:hypothetical protein